MELRLELAASPRPRRCSRPPAPTVRVVRADYFSTKGQGFLYVEARTTQGAQTTPVVGMTLESDTGAGHRVRLAAHDDAASWTPACTCSTATCSRSTRRREADPRTASRQRPAARRSATSRSGSTTSRRCTPTRLQVGLRRRLQDAAAGLRALRADRRSSTRTSPRSCRSRTRPTATSARRRRRSARPGRPPVRGRRELRRVGP